MDPFNQIQHRMNQLWRELSRESSPWMSMTELPMMPAITASTSVNPQSQQQLQLQPQSQQQLTTAIPSTFPTLFPQIRLDISETPESVLVNAELPGFTRENLKINLADDGILHIRADRTEEKEEKGEEWRYRERHRGSVQRAVRLPTYTDPNGAQAEFKDGVLKLKFGKRSMPGKQIEIQQ